MYFKEVVVQNQVGLCARPATYFIQKANEFQSLIWVEKEERKVNAKSLLGILSLGIMGGTAIKIIADGVDEEAAVDQLVQMVKSGFTEGNDEMAIPASSSEKISGTDEMDIPASSAERISD